MVFDTETTGFHPAHGDEILAIAAIRIVNGRILSGEKFEQLIKPELPIPESSKPFLEVTDESLSQEPSIQEVLPHFKSFVDEAVLVAHNGAFDMTFFQLMEDKSGIVFTNPLLDTLLLANIIEKTRTDHTLENIGRQLGIDNLSCQSTMGDCFLIAQIFLKQLELLKEQGIETLGQAISASNRLIKLNKKDA